MSDHIYGLTVEMLHNLRVRCDVEGCTSEYGCDDVDTIGWEGLLVRAADAGWLVQGWTADRRGRDVCPAHLTFADNADLTVQVR